MDRPFYIAIDFDDTLFIRKSWRNMDGEANQKTINLIKHLHKKNWKIILWTSRNGKLLEEAVQFCKDYDVHIDYVNENPEAIKWFKNKLGFKESSWSPKVFADIYLDDSAFNPNILEGLKGYSHEECAKFFEDFCETRIKQKVEISEKTKKTPKNKREFPDYVCLGQEGGSALVHRGNGRYYRDAGRWSVQARFLKGKVVCKADGGLEHLEGVELVPTTNEFWAKDNEQYL